MYLAVKYLHITCVALSLAGFLLRGLWMYTDASQLRAPLTRRLPHVLDAVLLASAIALAVMSGQAPFVQAWLTAKVAGLLVYIVLGALALRPGRPKAGWKQQGIERTVAAANAPGEGAGWVVCEVVAMMCGV